MNSTCSKNPLLTETRAREAMYVLSQTITSMESLYNNNYIQDFGVINRGL